MSIFRKDTTYDRIRRARTISLRRIMEQELSDVTITGSEYYLSACYKGIEAVRVTPASARVDVYLLPYHDSAVRLTDECARIFNKRFIVQTHY